MKQDVGRSLPIIRIEMKISGFTFVRNATSLYLPAKQAIASVLPLVDEFLVALASGNEDDRTREDILSLGSDKIKIINTTWETASFPKNTEFARQTDIARRACTGDWLFYIQCDEAIHEDYLPIVRKAMENYLDDREVEGLLFHYLHFWGDFWHYNPNHVFYPREIRVIRNLPQIHSWKDAQSFRYYEEHRGTFADYDRKEGTRKLRVAQVNAWIYHYGWARPPRVMMSKTRKMSETYRGTQATNTLFKKALDHYDYGPLGRFPEFKGTHPAAMKSWVEAFDWADELNYSRTQQVQREPEHHEKLKYRLLTWVEQTFLGGRRIGEFKNFKRIR